MVRLRKGYKESLGLPESISSPELSKLLIDMMLKSSGGYTGNQVVEVLGTVETQDLRLQVSTKEAEMI